MNLIFIATITSFTAFLIRIILILRQIKSARRTKQSSDTSHGRKYIRGSSTITTVVVLGSGGHTTEMMHMLASIKQYHEHLSPIKYIVAETDTTSIRRLEAFAASKKNNNTTTGHGSHSFLYPHNSNVYKIPRAREVGQSYISSIFTTLYSLLYTAKLILHTTRPDLLIVNGPGTCLPIAIWTYIARILGLSRGNIVLIESFCRVQSLSLTGKVLWKMGIVDLFLVHWPELLKNVTGSSTENTMPQEMVLVECFLKHNSNNMGD